MKRHCSCYDYFYHRLCDDISIPLRQQLRPLGLPSSPLVWAHTRILYVVGEIWDGWSAKRKIPAIPVPLVKLSVSENLLLCISRHMEELEEWGNGNERASYRLRRWTEYHSANCACYVDAVGQRTLHKGMHFRLHLRWLASLAYWKINFVVFISIRRGWTWQCIDKESWSRFWTVPLNPKEECLKAWG